MTNPSCQIAPNPIPLLIQLPDVDITGIVTGNTLVYNTVTKKWTAGSGGGGGGTVTSVGVSSTDLSVSGSPVTTTGTITLNINSNAVTFAKIQQIATSRLLGRSTAGTGNVEELTIGSGLSLAGGVLSASGGGTVTSVGVSSTDLSVSGSPVTTTGTITLDINSNAVTFAKIQQIATSRLLGRSTAGTGNVEELTIGSGLSLAGGVLSASGGGTVTSVSASGGTTGLSFTGSPITTSGTITLTGTLAVANGGTGVTTSTGANSVMLRDANGNTNLVNLLEGYATTATAAGTTTLTVSSAKNQYFTGSTTQTVTMPVTSTLVLGQEYVITNNSTGNVTVQSSGANSIVVLAQNQTARLTCILTSGTTAASWNFRLYATTVGGYTAPTLGTTSIASGATVTTINGLTLTTTTMTASTNVLGGVTMTLGSDQNGDMYFRQGGVLTRVQLGAAGSFLKSLGGIPSSTAPYSVSSQSVDYTLVLADASSVLYLTGSVAKSFTVPPNSTAAFAIGTVITFYQDGTGALTIVAGSGVTIRSEYGLILNTQYSVATITKIATDTWILGGSLRVS